jgi:predicted TIM-barrel fold metal-dependent hydrolase
LYGIKEFNDKSIITFAEKIKSDNKPGIYKKILCDLCHIKYSITCYNDNSPIAKDFMLKTIIRGEPRIQDLLTSKNPPKDINEFIDIVKVILRKNLKNGGIGFKMFVGEYGEDNLKLAESELKDFLKQKGTLFYEDRRQYSHLLCCYHNALFDVAAEANVPIAVHAGYWGDFRQLDPKMIFSFALRRQDVKFDLFHLGMPMVRDAAIIGKTLPNVTLNLVWCPIISQAQTASILNEIIDMVPLNKIIAFGGDYRVCIQNVYGHLKMAKEVVAGVLASRIEAGDFDMKEALRIAKMWFYENPARIYKLK